MTIRRIEESLKGPDADIVRAQNPTATSYDDMQALETAFGNTENPSDLFVKLRQKKLSTYLIRSVKLLHCMLKKGGVELSEMNLLCIERVVRGALPQDMIALRIPMTRKLRDPVHVMSCLKSLGRTRT